MITNKELVLQLVDRVIKEYEIILQKELFTKRNRLKNNISIFSSKSILCQSNISNRKLCQNDPKKGCFFYKGGTGCSRDNTFPLKVMRDDVNILSLRLEFWKKLRKSLISMPTTLFLKKYRYELQEKVQKVDSATYLRFQKLLNK